MFVISGYVSFAQKDAGYKSLDQSDPVVFGGDYIIYQGKTIRLGPNNFFIDGQLSDQEISKYKYVFNSVNKAVPHLSNGTSESPMTLYIAPYVYWIDDPDDPAIRTSVNGMAPFGLVIKCEWLRFYGLSQKAENVVLACNRGQTIGSQGNFTMFRFFGQGTSSENITFGNYCNIDLVYPLKPELNRSKRASAIVQAQLILCDGDKIVARNTRFISRLNLMPFLGGKRVLFDRCHFESTDDALNGTAVYLNSTLEFYSGKPFGGTSGTGAVLLNCDIKSFTNGNQYFIKLGGQIGVIDTRIISETATYVGWKDTPSQETRNYQYNVTFNGKQLKISKDFPASGVDMTGKNVLDSYRFIYNNDVIYNTYNLLCGNDDWDPMGIKDIVLKAEKSSGKKYTMLPVQLQISPTRADIETGKNNARLTAKIRRFGNYDSKAEVLTWAVSPEHKALVELKVSDDGMACDVIPANTRDETIQVIVTASGKSGLEAASVLNVAPVMLEAPAFISTPKIINSGNGKLKVNYRLDMRFDDQSLVTWFRCTGADGSNPVEVAVSRQNKPLLEYELSQGDIGYFIRVSVAPKHLRCKPGKEVFAIMSNPVTASDVRSDPKVLYTDFRNASTKNQPDVIPGFWTMRPLESPAAEGRQIAAADNRDAWYYGEGTDGAANMTGLLQGRYAGLLYTPVGKEFGDMKLSMTVVPFKTAGQGFSVAPLYMDILINFDTKSMTGYALRFIRTTKYHDAVDCLFVRYDKGIVSEISEHITTSCYRPVCEITLKTNGNKIMASARTQNDYSETPPRKEVLKEVNIECGINPDKAGGFGIQYYGGSSTMIKELRAEWK